MSQDQTGDPGGIGRLAASSRVARRVAKATRRAFAEFLTIPTVVIGLFLLFVAACTYPRSGAHSSA